MGRPITNVDRERSRRQQQRRINRERGVALITVLLVFAVVAVIAAEMLRRSQLNLRSVGNLIESRQAYYYALGGEALARQLLAMDVKNGHGEADALDEAWAKVGEQAPFEIEGGAIKVEINDLQGRFNLNALVDTQGQPIETGVALPQLRQLLGAVGVDVRYAERWRDWVDRDQAPQPGGAEDAAYPTYKTAGGPEADISALRLLQGMRPEDYDKIAPHVATLPADALININTADSVVLRSLPPIISAHASQIQSKQRQGGYTDLEQLRALLGGGADTTGLAVNSSYFEVITSVKYADLVLRLRSVLKRDQNSGAITVLSRTRTPFVETADSENQQP